MSVQNRTSQPYDNPTLGTPLRVLLTGGGGAGTEAMWLLLSRSYDVWVADADVNRIHPVVRRDRIRAIPFAADPGFAEAMVALCRAESIDVLVPGVDEELLALSRAAPVLLPTQLMVPQPDFVETMLDKWQFFEALGDSGIAVPVTVKLEESDNWEAFPCIVKPRHGRGSRGVTVINNQQELFHHRKLLGDRELEYVVQQYLEGVEYTVQVFSDRQGRLSSVVPARVALKRGVTISCETDPAPAVIEVCEAIHSRFNVSGCYNVQGILSRDGRFLPFEINPRVSTTLCLSVAAGIDPIATFLGSPGGFSIGGIESRWRLERFWMNHLVRVEGEA